MALWGRPPIGNHRAACQRRHCARQPTAPPGPLQDDLERVRRSGQGRVDITVGSALDIFGGKLAYADVVAWHRQQAAAAAAAAQ